MAFACYVDMLYSSCSLIFTSESNGGMSEYDVNVCVCYLAGYNNVDVAEFLLENGADVNAQDKGGLIPLHNASSYGVSRI